MVSQRKSLQGRTGHMINYCMLFDVDRVSSNFLFLEFSELVALNLHSSSSACGCVLLFMMLLGKHPMTAG